MAEWTEVVVRHRRVVLLTWVVLGVLGAVAASDLGSLLSNRFSVPGSDAERGLNILRTQFHERSDGAFTLVVRPNGGSVNRAAVEAAAGRAAGVLANGKAGPVLPAGRRGRLRPDQHLARERAGVGQDARGAHGDRRRSPVRRCT